MKIPKPISELIDSFERLPGIGPKTAQRLTFYLLHFPQSELEKFAKSLEELKKGTVICNTCRNIDEQDPCSICSAYDRDRQKLVVVSGPLDVFAFEKVGYKGLFHVLHGVIDPLNNIGPDDLYVNEIVGRVQKLVRDEGFVEVILATNTSMEGESTAMYIAKMLKSSGLTEDEVKITRIARGLPVGGDIEYADDITLTRALDGRSAF